MVIVLIADELQKEHERSVQQLKLFPGDQWTYQLEVLCESCANAQTPINPSITVIFARVQVDVHLRKGVYFVQPGFV